MSVYPFIIDSQPSYLPVGPTPASLLTAPLGIGTLMNYVLCMIRPIIDNPITVLTTFQPSREYRNSLSRKDGMVRDVIHAAEFEDRVLGLESSDQLFVIDPSRLPENPHALSALLPEIKCHREAAHVLSLGADAKESRELVHLDRKNRIRRIERYYPGVTWLRGAGVLCSMLPVALVRFMQNLSVESLFEMRRELISEGFPSRDSLLEGGVLDLTKQSGLLSLSERLVFEIVSAPPPPGFNRIVEGVYVGSNCSIDASARIYGPVIIQDGVTVDAEVSIIGPTVLGAGCHIGRNSFLAESTVLSGTRVVPETTVHRRLLGTRSDRGDTIATEDDAAEGTFHETDAIDSMLDDTSFTAAAEKVRHRGYYQRIKRVSEAILAVMGLLVLSPLLMAVAALIKIRSKGPVFFAHQREGLNGKSFRCWKFRTMVQGADTLQRELYANNTVDGPQFKLPEDPRVTRIGRLLRQTNIDELPQLFNVVLGQMSLIGPRPSPFRENQICVPWRRARLSVRPGITGLWQVCRHDRSAGDFHQWIYYDMMYVRHASSWIDIKILIATVVTLGGKWSVPLHFIVPRRVREHENTVERSLLPAESLTS